MWELHKCERIRQMWKNYTNDGITQTSELHKIRELDNSDNYTNERHTQQRFTQMSITQMRELQGVTSRW